MRYLRFIITAFLFVAVALPTPAHTGSVSQALGDIADSCWDNKVSLLSAGVGFYFFIRAWSSSREERDLRRQLRSTLAQLIEPEAAEKGSTESSEYDSLIDSFLSNTDISNSFIEHVLTTLHSDKKHRSADAPTLNSQQQVVLQFRTEIDNAERDKTLFSLLSALFLFGAAIKYYSDSRETVNMILSRDRTLQDQPIAQEIRAGVEEYCAQPQAQRGTRWGTLRALRLPKVTLSRKKKKSRNPEKEALSYLRVIENIAHWYEKKGVKRHEKCVKVKENGRTYYTFMTRKRGFYNVTTDIRATSKREAFRQAVQDRHWEALLREAEKAARDITDTKTRNIIFRQIAAARKELEISIDTLADYARTTRPRPAANPVANA